MSRAEPQAAVALDMEALEPALRQFSCPQEPATGLPEQIGLIYASAVARLFVQRYGEQIDATSTGLRDALEAWLAGEPRFDAAWDFVLGEILEYMRRPDDRSPTELATRLGLRVASAARAPGEWDAPADGRTRLRFAEWVLPAAKRVTVRSSGERALVELDGREFRFSAREGHWDGEGVAERAQLARAGGRSVAILPRNMLLGTDFTTGEAADAVTAVVEPEMVAACQAAADLLAKHAPAYLDWVTRLVGNVVAVRSKPGKLLSGSSSDVPSAVYMSLPQEPPAVAEMLVHEATHQYFHLAKRIGPVDDGSDSGMYYSPAVGRERPLDRILVAYHAFANVALLYESFIAAGADDGGYSERKREELLPQLDSLEAPLRGSPALTPVGRALWEPLAERLEAVRRG